MTTTTNKETKTMKTNKPCCPTCGTETCWAELAPWETEPSAEFCIPCDNKAEEQADAFTNYGTRGDDQ